VPAPSIRGFVFPLTAARLRSRPGRGSPHGTSHGKHDTWATARSIKRPNRADLREAGGGGAESHGEAAGGRDGAGGGGA
jgi:hypothetical protein